VVGMLDFLPNALKNRIVVFGKVHSFHRIIWFIEALSSRSLGWVTRM
jgi:hypothetical protein